VDWINLAQNRDECCVLVKTVTNLSVPWNMVNLLTSWWSITSGLCLLELVIYLAFIFCLSYCNFLPNITVQALIFPLLAREVPNLTWEYHADEYEYHILVKFNVIFLLLSHISGAPCSLSLQHRSWCSRVRNVGTCLQDYTVSRFRGP
jgi:hypothetical protein